MGKRDNIKRAKKLKKAKRRKDLETSFGSASEPAGTTLRQRIAGSKITIKRGKIKYSELLIKFVCPIINEGDDVSILKTKYAFAVSAWNAAIIRENDKGAYQKEKRRISSLLHNVPAFEELFEGLAQRKEEEFSEYKKIIADMELKRINGSKMDVSVAIVEPEEVSIGG